MQFVLSLLFGYFMILFWVWLVQVRIPNHRVTYLYEAYTCLAKNSHGSSNDTFHLIEACKSTIVLLKINER